METTVVHVRPVELERTESLHHCQAAWMAEKEVKRRAEVGPNRMVTLTRRFTSALRVLLESAGFAGIRRT